MCIYSIHISCIDILIALHFIQGEIKEQKGRDCSQRPKVHSGSGRIQSRGAVYTAQAFPSPLSLMEAAILTLFLTSNTPKVSSQRSSVMGVAIKL